ncbi:hypothetical protein ABW19_dt0205784 [Dactylella cylindrospora]|nr:hypothetical protein ABW19_dt0205784 [Dactylella cylindrospora]
MLFTIQKVALHGLAVSAAAVVSNFGSSREHTCCLALKHLSPGDVSFNDSSFYANETRMYFSAANIVQPACVFAPRNAEKIASAVQIFNKAKCCFSIRGGGHSPVPNINGKDGAVLIITEKLNMLDIKAGVSRIGTGNTWSDVYRETDKANLVIPGGRVGSVGVGGLVLGGGISFQGSEYGFSCDNVVNFQIVTGDGLIRNANATSNSDLFWALKGGGNRFGIVTAIDIKTYPLSKVFGGTITYLISSLPQVLAQVDVFHREERDPKTSLILNIIDGVDVGAGQFITLVLYYGVPAFSPPEIFRPFYNIPGIVSNTIATQSFSKFVPLDGVGLPPGVFSHSWRTLTYKRSPGLNKRVAGIYQDEVAALRSKRGANVTPGIFTLAYEPFSTGFLAASKTKGGNPLGLDSRQGPQMLLLLTYSWVNKTESNFRVAALKKSVESMKSAAISAGKHVNFLYLNGAAPDQLPYHSYGKGNFERLQKIRAKYDPNDIFSKLQTGGFPL